MLRKKLKEEPFIFILITPIELLCSIYIKSIIPNLVPHGFKFIHILHFMTL